MKYNFQKAIFRENWVGGTGKQTYGLTRDAALLGRVEHIDESVLAECNRD